MEQKISILDELSKKYNIKEGDKVIVQESNYGVTIVLAKVVPKLT